MLIILLNSFNKSNNSSTFDFRLPSEQLFEQKDLKRQRFQRLAQKRNLSSSNVNNKCNLESFFGENVSSIFIRESQNLFEEISNLDNNLTPTNSNLTNIRFFTPAKTKDSYGFPSNSTHKSLACLEESKKTKQIQTYTPQMPSNFHGNAGINCLDSPKVESIKKLNGTHGVNKKSQGGNEFSNLLSLNLQPIQETHTTEVENYTHVYSKTELKNRIFLKYFFQIYTLLCPRFTAKTRFNEISRKFR